MAHFAYGCFAARGLLLVDGQNHADRGVSMIGGVCCAIVILIYAGALVRWIGIPPKRGFHLRTDWLLPFEEGLRRVRALERLHPLLYRPKMTLALLEGGACSPDRLLRWLAESAALACGTAVGGWLLASLAGNPAAGWFGTLVGCMIPALRARDLSSQSDRRRLRITLELPVLLSRLMVLVNAGENVWRALPRTMDARPLKGHPLYDELSAALAAMNRGESMNLAMEEFGRRCAMPEAKLFAAVLLMNAKRGGEELVPALRELTRQLWDKRKAAARTLGEQASSRLAFPLVLIFLIIILLVGAPAFLMM
jgi:tight adherence protein C